jgi:UDP-N-acetyl-D-mannosaminuronate dehydrogenase
VGGHCIPVYPRLYLWNDPDATVVSAARAANAAMPDYTIGLLEGAYGDLTGARVVVLGASYRGGVKETAFSGVFAAVEALKARGAAPTVHDPMYTDDELVRLGFEPFHLGDNADAAVVQADHAEYRELGPSDLRGIKAFIDGRRVSAADRWPGVQYRVIGKAIAPNS